MNQTLNPKFWLQLIIFPTTVKRNPKYSNSPPDTIYDNDYFPGHGVDDISIALSAPSLYVPTAPAFGSKHKEF
jgi:hypothetical protein